MRRSATAILFLGATSIAFAASAKDKQEDNKEKYTQLDFKVLKATVVKSFSSCKMSMV